MRSPTVAMRSLIDREEELRVAHAQLELSAAQSAALARQAEAANRATSAFLAK